MAVVLAAIVVMMGFFVWSFRNAHLSEVDSTTLCPVNQPIPEVVAVLIDATDTLTDAQRLDALNRLAIMQSQMPVFALLEIYAVDGETFLPEPLVSLCNPGDGASKNMAYENPAMAQRRWETEFKGVVDGVILRAIAAEEAPASPILEAMQSVTLRSFEAPGRQNAAHTLVVISDLIHHVPGKYSQYRDARPYEAVASDPYILSARPRLGGISVVIMQARRQRGSIPMRPGEHATWWLKALVDAGAAPQKIEFRPLAG